MEEYVYILSINIILSVSDGLYDEGKKKVSKIIELVGLSLIFLLGYTTEMPIYLLLLSGILIRFGVFNVTYNLTRRLKITYIGTTDYIDLLLGKVNPAILPMWYLVSLCTGFGLLYNYA